MGLLESKLYAQTTKPLIQHDGQNPLPSFSMDAAKFSDGSSGFVITTVDLAKNSSVRTISVKFAYSPSENSLIFVGNDETILSFVRDRLSGKVVCAITTQAKENIVRFCVTTYDPLDNAMIDQIAELYAKQPQRPL